MWSSRAELLSSAASGQGGLGLGSGIGIGLGLGLVAAGAEQLRPPTPDLRPPTLNADLRQPIRSSRPRPPHPTRPGLFPLSAPRAARAQDYVVATETEERDPVPSYVLVHYLKEDAPTSAEVLPPIIIQDDLPPAAQNLDEDQTEEVQGSLFAGFHLPAGSFPTSSTSSLAIMKRNLDEAGLDFLDDAEAYPPPHRGGKGGRGGRKQTQAPRPDKVHNAHNAASAMLALTRQ